MMRLYLISTGITSTSFTGCIRGFSGITGYNVGVSSSLIDVNREKLTFEDTIADSHANGSNRAKLICIIHTRVYKKLKKTFLQDLRMLLLHLTWM